MNAYQNAKVLVAFCRSRQNQWHKVIPFKEWSGDSRASWTSGPFRLRFSRVRCAGDCVELYMNDHLVLNAMDSQLDSLGILDMVTLQVDPNFTNAQFTIALVLLSGVKESHHYLEDIM